MRKNAQEKVQKCTNSRKMHKKLEMFTKYNLRSKNAQKIKIFGNLMKNLHLDLQNVIQFKPFQFDLAQTFADSNLLIIPSINETFGMVTIEGMRAGLPLLGSNTGGTKALIHDNKCGLTFDPADAQSLADQWSVLMDDHQLRSEYSKNARTAFETHYHIEGQMIHWMKILKGK